MKLPAFVGVARQAHDAGTSGGKQQRQQQPGEGEVPEIVCRQLHLEAVEAAFTLRRRHDAGVQDKQVQRFACRKHLLGKAADRSQGRQVEAADKDLRTGLLVADALGCSLAALQ